MNLVDSTAVEFPELFSRRLAIASAICYAILARNISHTPQQHKNRKDIETGGFLGRPLMPLSANSSFQLLFAPANDMYNVHNTAMNARKKKKNT